MKLSELVNPYDLRGEIDAGYVSLRRHDDDASLVIFNYTKKAQAEAHWNEVTTKTRGLIVRIESTWDGEIIARPFEKFWNLGEYVKLEDLDLDQTVVATDKIDGSLGILYPHPKGGWAIATRGSFHSEQAIRGTQILQKYLDGSLRPDPNSTYLFEIIYPENRIVVDYSGTEDLILLAAYETDPLHPLAPRSPWNLLIDGPFYQVGTLREILALPPRENAEGWVLQLQDGLRLKVKQEDYIRLHRIVTGLNELAVWEYGRDHGFDMGGLYDNVPEEFHGWLDKVSMDLGRQFSAIVNTAYREFTEAGGEVLDKLDRGARKEFAERAKESAYPSLLFLLADGKWISAAAWKMIRPNGNKLKPTRAELELAA